MELSLSRNVKDDKKGFCKYVCDKRKCVSAAEGDVEPGYAGHVRGCVLNTYFASVFITKSHPSGIPETREKIWSKEDLPVVEEDQVRKCVGKLIDEMHPGVLRELAGVIVIFHLSAGKEKCQETGGKQISLPSSRRARRSSQGTTGWSATPGFLGR